MVEYTPADAPELTGWHPESQIHAYISPAAFLRSLREAGVAGRGFYVERSSLNSIREKLLAGQALDPLFIDYDPIHRKVVRHEGRHRATAAIELGIQWVPVVIYFYTPDRYWDVKDERGYVYDETHYTPLDEVGKNRIDHILAEIGAHRVGSWSEGPPEFGLRRPRRKMRTCVCGKRLSESEYLAHVREAHPIFWEDFQREITGAKQKARSQDEYEREATLIARKYLVQRRPVRVQQHRRRSS